MRQHRKGVNSPKHSARGLYLRCKDDSNLLHSIDIHKMVKILCAVQEYFKWDILLTFTCNARNKFVTTPIHEWIYDKKWKFYFLNWGTYYFFQNQEIKRALYQSASGLFL